MKRNNIFSSRTFQYGTISVVFTAVFVSVIILVNIIVSAVNTKVGLYLDLTSEKIFGISAATETALQKIKTPVEIIFCKTADKVDDDADLGIVKKLAETYAERFSFVTIKYIDIVADPTAVIPFKTTSATDIPNTSVIVNCPSTKQFKVFLSDAFYTKAESTGQRFAFNGEMRFTSAILQTARPDAPKALFTTGHGETISAPLKELLSNAGYQTETIDLKTEKIDPSTKLIIVCAPQNDFTGLQSKTEGQSNEISALNDYLTTNFGNLMVFLDPQTPSLPELSEFLGDDWGIGYTSGQIIVDTKTALTSDGFGFGGIYSTQKDFGYQLHRQISEKPTAPAVVSYLTTPLSVLFSEKNARVVSAAIYSPASSEIRLKNELVKKESSPIVVLSTYQKMVQNVEKNAHVLAFGSVTFASDLVQSSSYSNGDLLNSAFKLMGNENALVNIPIKPFNDTALTVNQTDFTNYVLLLSLVVPALMLLVGTFVWYRRRRL